MVGNPRPCEEIAMTSEIPTWVVVDEIRRNSGPKNHDSHRRDKILRFFLRPGIGQFSPHFGVLFLLNHTEKPGKKGKNPQEKIQKMIKSSRDGAPKLQISVPCCGRPEEYSFFWALFFSVCFASLCFPPSFSCNMRREQQFAEKAREFHSDPVCTDPTRKFLTDMSSKNLGKS